MKEKKTIAQKLHSRKIKQPPKLIYLILAFIWKKLFYQRLGMNVEYKADPRGETGPYIVVSNHASRVDYVYTGIPFLPYRLNYVAGYNEFFRSHLALVFRLLQVIPKKNFTPDVYTIKEVSRVLRSGGRVCIFPEGMSSISGGNQPVALGSAKFLKHFGVPVYVCKIRGGYLTNTKYCLDERRGKVQITVDKLFMPDELKALSLEQITDRLHEAIHHDDYEWNKTARVAFDGHGEMAKNMHDLLYRCPRCGKEFTMIGEGDVIRCQSCGNGARLNEYYDLIPLTDDCVLPETPKVWFDMERAYAREAVRQEGFALSEKVRLGTLPAYRYLTNNATSNIVGEGVLTLDCTGLTYEGSRDGETVRLHQPIDLLPTYGMCTDVSRIYTFIDGEFYEFYPENHTVGKWLHCTEEMHRFMGGKWQDFPRTEEQAEQCTASR